MKTCIVKRSFSIKALTPSFVIIAAGALLAFASLMLLPALFFPLMGIGVIIGAVIASGNISTEYEYNLEGDSFSVALIKNNSSRKELFSSDMAHLLSCEPYSGGKLYGTTLNFSENVNTAYSIVFNEEGKQTSVIFSPDEAFVRELFLVSPSKVKRI